MEGIDSQQNHNEKLEELKTKLKTILDFKVEVENLKDIDLLIDQMLDSTVNIIKKASEIYAKNHPDIKNIHELEDSALNEFGLGNVPSILDQLNEIKYILEKQIPNIISKAKFSENITPTDTGNEKFPVAQGSEFENKLEKKRCFRA